MSEREREAGETQDLREAGAQPDDSYEEYVPSPGDTTIRCDHCGEAEAVEELEVRRGAAEAGYARRLCGPCAAHYRATYGDEARTPEEWAEAERAEAERVAAIAEQERLEAEERARAEEERRAGGEALDVSADDADDLGSTER